MGQENSYAKRGIYYRAELVQWGLIEPVIEKANQ